MDEDQISQVGLEEEQDLIFLTVKQYKFFLTHGKEGRIARDVYLHLLFTYRLQKNRSVWASTSYIAEGLGIGLNAVRDAKAFLKKHKIIEYRQDVGEAGRFEKLYIFLIPDPEKFTTGSKTPPVDTAGIKTGAPVNRCSGKQTQILKLETEILDKKKKDVAPEKALEKQAPFRDDLLIACGSCLKKYNTKEAMRDGPSYQCPHCGFWQQVRRAV